MDIWLIVFVVFVISAFSVLIIASMTKNLKKLMNPPPITTTSSQVQVIYSSSFQMREPFSNSTNELCHAATINDNLPPPPYHSLSLEINQFR